MRQRTFPFSYYRPRIDTPEVAPSVDIEALSKLDGFLTKNDLVVLDDVTYSYRYGRRKYEASVPVLLSYTGYQQLRGFFTDQIVGNPNGKGLVLDLLLGLEDRSREVLHRAKDIEANLGMFYGLGLMRQRALTTAQRKLSESGELPDEMYTRHCSDAIIDFGQCMLHPITIPSPYSEFNKYNPQLAIDIQEFGLFTHEVDRDELATDLGREIMGVVGNEQERRVKTFQPRYDALIDVIGTQMPKQVITPEMTDEQLLGIEFIEPDGSAT